MNAVRKSLLSLLILGALLFCPPVARLQAEPSTDVSAGSLTHGLATVPKTQKLSIINAHLVPPASYWAGRAVAAGEPNLGNYILGAHVNLARRDRVGLFFNLRRSRQEIPPTEVH